MSELGMIIHHKEARTHTIMLPAVALMQDGKPVVLTDSRTGKESTQMRSQEPVCIEPGINFLPREEYDLIKDNEGYVLRVAGDEDTDTPATIDELCEGDTLEDVPDELRPLVIKNTMNENELEQFITSRLLTTEQRRDVKLQLMKLRDPAKAVAEENRQLAKDRNSGRKRRPVPASKVRKRRKVTEEAGED